MQQVQTNISIIPAEVLNIFENSHHNLLLHSKMRKAKGYSKHMQNRDSAQIGLMEDDIQIDYP